MDVKKYLERIGIEGEAPAPTAEKLKSLQREHLLHVPFENLDIHWKRPIVLNTDAFYRKVVGDHRGGFCYELNGLFDELLRALGYETKLVSARVSNGEGGFSREYDHAAIIVRIDGDDYLADVGFGAFTAEPLKLELDLEQEDRTGAYVIRDHGDGYFIVLKGEAPEYIFKPLARELNEFAEMCNFHQTSPVSHFTRGKVCSLMTADGRKTLRDNRFISTVGDEKTETDVVSEAEFDVILAREFGISRQSVAGG
jgi:N-hydroxyarylamine O-acetyltransferase